MNATELQRFADFVFDHEARKDPEGNRPAIYPLPKSDHGGRFEVAGITDEIDASTFIQLKRQVEQRQFGLARATCRTYYITQTNPVAQWSPVTAIEFYLRDTCFHRGKGGACLIVQIASGVKQDKQFGPITKAALAQLVNTDVHDALKKLRAATERYENEHCGERPDLRRGLVNRWNDRLAFALTFLA